MENASKALIIAGAILLSIAIIGIGMYVYQMASSTVSKANMTSQEIDAYNSEFVKYEGTNNGSQVRAMLDVIRSHNLINDDDASKQIVVAVGECDGSTVDDDGTAGTAAGTIGTLKNAVVSGTKYKVTFNYTSTGLIKEIKYQKVGG